MSEILRPQLQGSLMSSSSLLSQSLIPSLVAPFHERTVSLKEHRAQVHSSELDHEDVHKRPLLSNYSSSTTVRSSDLQIRLANEKQHLVSPAKKNLKDYVSRLPKAPFLPQKSHYHQGMKTLVLDMDETLIHASTKPVSGADSVVKLSDGTRFYILKRPYLDEFLEQLSKVYELVIYTAGDKEYATTIIDEIDKSRYISYILHRDHCLRGGAGAGKDLSLIGRSLRDVIFIDNLEDNLRRQRENGIKILDFYDNRNDEELKKLIPFLQYASELDDVRPTKRVQAEFLAKALKPSINSEMKPELEPSKGQRVAHQRKDSTSSGIKSTPKVLNIVDEKLKVGQSITDIGYYFYTPVKKDGVKNEGSLSKTQILSPPKESTKAVSQTRIEERPGYLRNSLLISSSRVDEGIKMEKRVKIPSNEITNSSSELPRTENRTEKRVVLGKETITYGREKESGSLIESRPPKLSNPPRTLREIERSPLLEDLYERINQLELKLKAKCFKSEKAK